MPSQFPVRSVLSDKPYRVVETLVLNGIREELSATRGEPKECTHLGMVSATPGGPKRLGITTFPDNQVRAQRRTRAEAGNRLKPRRKSGEAILFWLREHGGRIGRGRYNQRAGP